MAHESLGLVHAHGGTFLSDRERPFPCDAAGSKPCWNNDTEGMRAEARIPSDVKRQTTSRSENRHRLQERVLHELAVQEIKD